LSANNKNIARNRLGRSLAISVAIFAFSAAQAYADSTFLLQFGSFNTQEQATQKWDDIKAKNPDLVGKLTLHVAEVALPPDNTIMYRTQAGPLPSRTQASGLCGTLKTRNIDCFVVETALFTAEPSSMQAQNDVSPSLPSLPPLTVTSPIPADAPINTPTLAAPVAQSLPVPPPPPPLVSAAVNKPAVSAAVPPTAKPVVTASNMNEDDKPGFFGRLFGSSSSSPSAPVAVKTVTPAPVPVPARITTAAVTPPPPPAVAAAAPVTYLSSEGTPVAINSKYSNTTDTESVPFPVPNSASVMSKPLMAPAPVPEPMYVPVAPTPAPAHESAANASSNADLNSAPTSVPSHPAANWTVPGREPKFLNQPSHSATATNSMTSNNGSNSNVVGDVKVAEAIRVPVGSGAKPKKIVMLPPVHGMGGTPSATTHKTFWAQLSYFPDEEQARNFYDKFQADYPQFSDGVRVRITHPYSSSAGRVSLRVGPFVGTDDVHTICKAAAERSVSCNIVKEVGTSSSVSTAREHTLYHSNSETVSAASEAASENTAPQYWLQLGTFHSSDDAWDNWKDLQAEHKKLLRKAHADVSVPGMSSAQRALYRLRVGPYSSESSAEDVCDKLDDAGISCILVNDH
jgi:hypothetical protein